MRAHTASASALRTSPPPPPSASEAASFADETGRPASGCPPTRASSQSRLPPGSPDAIPLADPTDAGLDTTTTAAAAAAARARPAHLLTHTRVPNTATLPLPTTIDDRTELSLGCASTATHPSLPATPAPSSSNSSSNTISSTPGNLASGSSTSTAKMISAHTYLPSHHPAPAHHHLLPPAIHSSTVNGTNAGSSSSISSATLLVGENHSAEGSDALDATSSASASAATVSVPSLAPNSSRKLCLRHQRMADENTTAKLQKSIESLPLVDQTAVNNVWTIFSSSPHPRRALILQGLLTMCCFSQLSLLSEELALAIRIDPFSLFPREVSLKVLGYLDASSLGRAAQVSHLWRSLADDDILWRNMCMQHIERKCEKCGWGLPLLKENGRRRKAAKAGSLTLPGSSPRIADAALPGLGSAAQPQFSSSQSSVASSSRLSAAGPSTQAAGTAGSLKRTITAAANAAAIERHRAANSTATSPVLYPEATISEVDEIDIDAPPSKRQKTKSEFITPSASSSSAKPAAPPSTAAPLTRPWKSVYCERLKIERNWRKCRYTTKVISGHEDGIMCLDYSDHLSHPNFPVLMTGSYDRTARVWNLETGEQLHVLRGHTRVVRCLQFDDCKLITGSMDRTLKIWNWRTGELMRTLEGHTEGILCLNFNEEILASGSLDASIKIWNFKTGQCYTLRGHTDWVNNVLLWSGQNAVTTAKKAGPSSSSRDARNWGERPMQNAPAPTPTMIGLDEDQLESTAAKHFLFSASDDSTIRLWDLGLRECILVFEGHVGQVQSMKLIHLDDDTIRKLTRNSVGGPGADEAERRRQELVAQQYTREAAAAAAAAARSTAATDGDGHAANGAPGLPELFPLPIPTPASFLSAQDGHRGSNGESRQHSHRDGTRHGSGSSIRSGEGISDSYFPVAGPSGSTTSAARQALHSEPGHGVTGSGDQAEGSGGCSIVPTTPSFGQGPNRSRSGSGVDTGARTPLASGVAMRHSPTLTAPQQFGAVGGPSGSTFPVPLSDPTRSAARLGEYTSARTGGSLTRAASGVLASSSMIFGSEHGDSAEATSSEIGYSSRPRRTLDPVLAHVQTRLQAAGLVPSIPLDAEMGDIEGPLGEALDEPQQADAGPHQQHHRRHYGEDALGDRRITNAAILGGGASSSSPRFASSSSEQARSSTASTSNTAAGAAASVSGSSGAKPALRPVLVSGSLDNTIKLWDVRTGRCLRTFFGHVQGVWSLDADKLRIISASLDRTIKIWDRETGFCQNTLVGHRGAVTCVSLGDDKIVSGSDDGDVRVWSFAD